MLTLIVAVIAAVAAITAAVIAYLGVRATNKAAKSRMDWDYRIRQLNELYGPLYMRRTLSLRLWKQLPGIPNAQPGKAGWNLIDHITEIRGESDGRRRRVVEDILQINDELADLLVGKSGLLQGWPPPERFEVFLEHAATLRSCWERGVNAGRSDYVAFPAGFDDDIRSAIQEIRSKIELNGTSMRGLSLRGRERFTAMWLTLLGR